MRLAPSAGLAACLLLALPLGAQTTSPVRRFEAGAELTNLGFSVCVNTNQCPPAPPRQAFGVTASVNFTPHLALDTALRASTQSIPTNPRYQGQTSLYANGSVAGGRATEFLAGPRAEARNDRFGLFAVTRIGLLSWSHIDHGYILDTSNGNNSYIFGYGRGTYLVVDPALGAEVSVTPRIRLRAEVGDQIIHYHHPSFAVTSTGGPDGTVYRNTVGSYTASVSANVSVGKALRIAAPAERITPSHRFFDKTNLTLFAITLLAESGDAVTTQRFRHHGIEEPDIFAKPLVDQRWPGQVALAILANSAALSFMYGLHRLHVHWAERLFPIAIAAASGYLTYSNLQLRYDNVR